MDVELRLIANQHGLLRRKYFINVFNYSNRKKIRVRIIKFVINAHRNYISTFNISNNSHT